MGLLVTRTYGACKLSGPRRVIADRPRSALTAYRFRQCCAATPPLPKGLTMALKVVEHGVGHRQRVLNARSLGQGMRAAQMARLNGAL